MIRFRKSSVIALKGESSSFRIWGCVEGGDREGEFINGSSECDGESMRESNAKVNEEAFEVARTG